MNPGNVLFILSKSVKHNWVTPRFSDKSSECQQGFSRYLTGWKISPISNVIMHYVLYSTLNSWFLNGLYTTSIDVNILDNTTTNGQ